MQGAANCEMKSGYAVLHGKIKGAKGRDSYLPATLSTDQKGRLLAEPLKWSGSSNFVGFAKAEALIFVASDKTLEKDETVKIVFLT